MPTSGLVLKLKDGPEGQAALDALQTRAELALGDLRDGWLPAALTTRDPAHSLEIHDRLLELPGIAFIEVVSVSFEDPLSDPLSPALNAAGAAGGSPHDPIEFATP